MDERDGQQGLLRDIYLWATSNHNSRDHFVGNFSDQARSGGAKKLLNSSVSVDNRQMKQDDMGSIGGSGSGGQEVVQPVASNGAKKRKNGDLKIKNEMNHESGDEDEKGIRDVLSSDHAKHLLTEKRRRKKMKNMFQELHALLPKQNPKAKLITIVDDAISYIRHLQQTHQNLETKKLESFNRPSTNACSVTSLTHPQKHTRESFSANASPSNSQLDRVSCPRLDPFFFPLHSKPVFQTWASSNVTLNVCGEDAHINICSANKPGLFTAVCVVLEKCKLDIVSVHVSSDQSKSMFMIHVRMNAPDEFMAGFSYEEIYKLAALEMMLLIEPKSS
ncbi:hypothetical protein R6Q59_022849 [Mikania micrantha]